MHICIFFLTFYSYTSSSIYVSNYLSTYLSFIWFSLSKCLFMSCQIRLNPTLARTVCYQIWSREMTQNDHWSFLTTWNLEWKRTPLFSYKGLLPWSQTDDTLASRGRFWRRGPSRPDTWFSFCPGLSSLSKSEVFICLGNNFTVGNERTACGQHSSTITSDSLSSVKKRKKEMFYCNGR